MIRSARGRHDRQYDKRKISDGIDMIKDRQTRDSLIHPARDHSGKKSPEWEPRRKAEDRPRQWR